MVLGDPHSLPPPISVLVPTLNEEAWLAATLARVTSEFAPFEIIVADSGSTDQTVARAQQWARVVILPGSRGAALNEAARIATGDILLVLHADSRLPLGAREMMADALRDKAVIAGAFRLRLDAPGLLPRLISASVNLRSRFLQAYFGDQALFVRREAFLRIGGYRPWSVMEDLEIIGRLRSQGRVVLLDGVVTTSARRHRSSGWVRTIFLVWLLSALNRLGVPPRVLYRLYAPRR